MTRRTTPTPTAALAALIALAPAALPCTGIFCFQDGVALAGNNEDFWNPDTRMWFVPGADGRLGRVYFGFPNGFPQGGMNEAGLFFDGFATAALPVTTTGDRPRFEGNLIDEAMATCGTVDEVIALFGRYDLRFLERAMLMFGDRTGESVIVEGDALLVKGRAERDQVVTNFYQSQSAPEQYTCPRYAAARRVLAESPAVTVDVVRRALDAAHQEGRAPTQYSNVYDLTRGVVHLYHFHDFEEVVTIDLEAELVKGAREVEIRSLFPVSDAYARYRAEFEQRIEEQKRERVATDVDPASFAALAGDYRVAAAGHEVILHLALEDGKLILRQRPDQAVELLPEGGDRFFHVDFDGATNFAFERGPDGTAATVTVTNSLGHRYSGARVVTASG